MINKNSPDEYWDSIKEKILNLIDQHHRPASEVILDDVDLRNLLKISRRTSLEYRKKGVYKFYKLDGKIFYILEEVIAGIKKAGGQNEN
jgi:transcriptional accessory protein Tex/SPT6